MTSGDDVVPGGAIDAVIADLDRIIEAAKAERSPLGYFAALYRMVTVEVQRGIVAGDFDDGARMERLDVLFARRYVNAFDRYRAGERVTESWALAFETTDAWWPIVLQHLLLGMNAHINLDLGIAAARTVPGAALPELRADFDRINEILSRLVDTVQDELARIWPLLRVLDVTAIRTDEAVVDFAMAKARDHAWRVAEELAPLPETAQETRIAEMDRGVAVIGRRVRRPGLLVGLVLKLVRVGEIGTVRGKIERLQGM